MARVMMEVSEDYANAIRAERKAWKRVEKMSRKWAEAVKDVWGHNDGDGEGGVAFDMLVDACEAAGLKFSKSRAKQISGSRS